MARPVKKISEFDVALGAVIRSKRTKTKMSQKDLAQKSGVALSNLQRREDGANEVTVSELERLAFALEVSPRSLVEEALRDYGGLSKLLREHASEGTATVSAEDNITYLGHVQPAYDLAADTNEATTPKE